MVNSEKAKKVYEAFTKDLADKLENYRGDPTYMDNEIATEWKSSNSFEQTYADFCNQKKVKKYETFLKHTLEDSLKETTDGVFGVIDELMGDDED